MYSPTALSHQTERKNDSKTTPDRTPAEVRNGRTNAQPTHFTFTITNHYLFPQLTMGFAPLIVVLKTLALRAGDAHYNLSARFWAKIFAVNVLLATTAA